MQDHPSGGPQAVDPRLVAYDYRLPRDQIAMRPPQRRDAGRLLCGTDDGWSDRHIQDLPTRLRRGDLVVVNDTRVMSARVFGRRKTGGAVELLLLEGEGNPVRAMARPARKLRIGESLDLCDAGGIIQPDLGAEIVGEAEDGARLVRFEPDPQTVMGRIGAMPLPPYIDRPADGADADRYQTVFADQAGAVAAPTAGLHLSADLLEHIDARGVCVAPITLHVGPGTFRNLRPVDLDRGQLHPERFVVPDETADAIARARSAGGRVIAVGTTVTRTLESAVGPSGDVQAGMGQTRLFIREGYRFQVVDGLLTNFHLPRTSLLMLVCAFGGRDRVLAGYRQAVDAGFRFYSYGDAMFLTRETSS